VNRQTIPGDNANWTDPIRVMLDAFRTFLEYHAAVAKLSSSRHGIGQKAVRLLLIVRIILDIRATQVCISPFRID
jgi:hypothetical protein